MPGAGLAVFDKTIQITHIWLSEVEQALGPDRKHAWKVLSTVLHKLRDRLPLGAAAHLGAQLPLLIRGVYYDQFTPFRQPADWRLEEFLEEIDRWLDDARPTDPEAAARAVLRTLSRHISPGEIRDLQGVLPGDIADFWMAAEEAVVPPPAPQPARSARKSANGKGDYQMRISDLMTRDVEIVHPDDTLQYAAQLMCECDIGFLPVGAGDRLVGMITDRDIAVRAVANGCSARERVGSFMTRDIKYCFADEDVEDVLDNMGDIKVRRLPVLDRNKRLVGVVSLGDAARRRASEDVGDTLRGIARPGGAHSQVPTYLHS